MTQNYELLYVIANKYSETEVKPIIEKIDNFLKQKKCEILKSEDWGKKKLAYPIKQSRYGYYILREFTNENEKENIREINHFLILAEEVIRHLIIKIKPIKKTTKIRKVKTKETLEEARPVKEEKIAKKEEDKKTKISLDNLDEKLDELLQEKII